MTNLGKVADLGERFGRGHEYLVAPLGEDRQKTAASLGIEFTEHVVEKDDRSDARRVLKVPDLGKLAREHDAPLLALRGGAACRATIEVERDVVAVGAGHGDPPGDLLRRAVAQGAQQQLLSPLQCVGQRRYVRGCIPQRDALTLTAEVMER